MCSPRASSSVSFVVPARFPSRLLRRGGFFAPRRVFPRIFFGQFRRTGSIPVSSFAAGALYAAAMVLAQLLSFANMFSYEPILSDGSNTIVWLWVAWHAGLALFASVPAYFAGDGLTPAVRPESARRIARIIVALTILSVLTITWLLSEHVALLPKLSEEDDYRLLTIPE